MIALLGLPGWAAAQPMAGGYRVASSTPHAPQPVDGCQLLAKVNGQVIMSCEVDWQVNLRLDELADRVPPEARDQVRSQLTQQMLMEMLDLRMLYADFVRSTQGAADMDAIRKSLEDPFQESELPRLMKVTKTKSVEELERRLLELGTSLRERKEDFVRSTIARQWIQQSLDFDKEVTHQQMLDYYHEHQQDYEFPTQAKWEELMVSFDRFPNERDAYRALANMGNQVFARARTAPAAEPVFTEVAKAQSQGFTADKGGIQDWTTKGALTAERLDQALFLLPEGQMSDILRSDRGFHIVRVLERKQAGRTPFTEVQDAITKVIQDERFGKAVNAKLTELKSKAHVWTAFTGDLNRGEEQQTR